MNEEEAQAKWDAIRKLYEERDALPYPLTVFTARYGGTYEGAFWLAFNERPGDPRLADAQGSDVECMQFYVYYERVKPIGRGDSAEEAIADLQAKLEAEPDRAWPKFLWRD